MPKIISGGFCLPLMYSLGRPFSIFTWADTGLSVGLFTPDGSGGAGMAWVGPEVVFFVTPPELSGVAAPPAVVPVSPAGSLSPLLTA